MNTTRPDPLLARAMAHCEQEGISMEAPLIASAISYARMTGQGFGTALAEMQRRAALKKTPTRAAAAAPAAAPAVHRPLPPAAAPVARAAAPQPVQAAAKPMDWTNPRVRATAADLAATLARQQGITFVAALKKLGHP